MHGEPKEDYDLISLGPNGNGDFDATTEAESRRHQKLVSSNRHRF